MQPAITVRAKDQYVEPEVQSFVTIAAKGEEVDRHDIERGAMRAAALLWMEDSGIPYAVAALKMPFESYKERVFRKAGVPGQSGDFSLELGYIYVEEVARGNGHAPRLVQKAVELYGREGIYATTRTDNKRMRRILEENGFTSVGSDYPSERNTSRLMLFVRQAAVE